MRINDHLSECAQQGIPNNPSHLIASRPVEARKQPAVMSRSPKGSQSIAGKRGRGTQEYAIDEKSGKKPVRNPAKLKTDRFEWHKELKGFGVRTQPSGLRTYVIQYRERGMTRRRKIGTVGVDDRRKMFRLAKRLLSKVDTHQKVIDPFTPSEPAAAPTLAQFAPRYWETRSHHWAPATQRTNRDAMMKVILPALGNLPVDAITKPHIAGWRDSLSSRPGIANRALPVLSDMMKTAERLQLRPPQSNPCRKIARLKTRRRLRFLTLAEVEALGGALARLQSLAPEDCDMIRMLLLTGARKNEIAGLRWGEINGHFLHLSETKTGPSTRYLGAAARDLLDRRRKTLAGGPGAEQYVFDLARTGRRPRLRDTIWRKARQEAGIEGVRLHDLRHTFASHAVMNGVTLPTVSRLLGHALIESSEIYAHLSETSVREASNRVGSRIARLTGFGKGGHA